MEINDLLNPKKEKNSIESLSSAQITLNKQQQNFLYFPIAESRSNFTENGLLVYYGPNQDRQIEHRIHAASSKLKSNLYCSFGGFYRLTFMDQLIYQTFLDSNKQTFNFHHAQPMTINAIMDWLSSRLYYTSSSDESPPQDKSEKEPSSDESDEFDGGVFTPPHSPSSSKK